MDSREEKKAVQIDMNLVFQLEMATYEKSQKKVSPAQEAKSQHQKFS